MARIGLIALLMALGAALLALPASAARIHSYAFVRSDGSLHIRGRTYRLYGIHIPQTGRSCGWTLRPARCGSRAALALDFKIQRFVTCQTISRNRDRSLNAVCWAGQVDLAAYLLHQGWGPGLAGCALLLRGLGADRPGAEPGPLGLPGR